MSGWTTFADLEPGLAGPYGQTLPKMRQQVAQCVLDPFGRVLDTVERVVCASGETRPSRARLAEILFCWQATFMGYVEDPTDMEMCRHPFVILRDIQDKSKGRGFGDCNNSATLMAALGHVVRLPIVWILCAPERNPIDQRHIFAAMLRDDAGSEDDFMTNDGLDVDDFLALDTGNRNPIFGQFTELREGGVAIPTVYTSVPSYGGAM